MTAQQDALITALTHELGDQNVLPGGDLPAYENDWRKRWQGRALVVVRPGNTQQVAAVLKLCAQHGASVVPQGGNTGLVGGGVPDDTGTQVLLSLQRMNRLRGIDRANLTLTVEAGMVLQAVQQTAADGGLLFPLSLAAEGSCSIGGNLATNAGGTQVLRYGNARDLCLGLEVVTAQGEVWDGLSGLRKDNTGYDLRDLFIGSEGTLGIITAATLKLYPQPAASLTALATCATLDDCVALLGLAQARLGAGLTGFEVMKQPSRWPWCASTLRNCRSRWPKRRGPCCWSTPMPTAWTAPAPASRRCWKRRWRPVTSTTPRWPKAWPSRPICGTCGNRFRWRKAWKA